MHKSCIAALGGGMVAMLACAPSIRGRQESTVYFERCHSADADPGIGVEARRQCWGTWLRHYSKNQCNERRQYARSRLAWYTDFPLRFDQRVAKGSAARLTSNGGVNVGTIAAEEAPEPSYGPPISAAGGLLESAAPHASPGSQSGSPPCVRLCEGPLVPCLRECEQRGKGCRHACDHEYRICLRGCF